MRKEYKDQERVQSCVGVIFCFSENLYLVKSGILLYPTIPGICFEN